MNAEFFLIIQGTKFHTFSTRRELGSVQVRKKKPRTNADEIAVKVHLDIPDSLFEKPTLEVTASVPDDAGPGPTISTQVADNIAEIIRRETGVSVVISGADQSIDEDG